MELSDSHRKRLSEFEEFSGRIVGPAAESIDRNELIPAEVLGELRDRRYLAAAVPAELGGLGLDMISLGLLVKSISRESASVAALVTVNAMFAHALVRWGTSDQQTAYLSGIVTEGKVAAFALTEPEIGSDAAGIKATAVPANGGYLLNGTKRWITGARIADVLLVFARREDQVEAFVVDAGHPAVKVKPIYGMLGHRGAMLGEVTIGDYPAPVSAQVGKSTGAMSYVAQSALDLGRLLVAWSSLGIAESCLEASVDYCNSRKQFGKLLRDHQLIREMIADMTVGTRSARLMCMEASRLRDAGDPEAVMATTIAKYHCSRVAVDVSHRAVQIHGANGCIASNPVERHFRDARIMEIIEGSSQIQQLIISRNALGRYPTEDI